MSGKLLLGTAEKIPPSELVDTTGAGDAFIGAVLYGKKIYTLQSLYLNVLSLNVLYSWHLPFPPACDN